MTGRKELSGRHTELRSVKAPRLARLFKPESIAVVGVTDSNDYSRRIIQNLTALGYPGPVYAVNPNFSGLPVRALAF
jgi:acyl-CoA synthetase (NDP forming)